MKSADCHDGSLDCQSRTTIFLDDDLRYVLCGDNLSFGKWLQPSCKRHEDHQRQVFRQEYAENVLGTERERKREREQSGFYCDGGMGVCR